VAGLRLVVVLEIGRSAAPTCSTDQTCILLLGSAIHNTRFNEESSVNLSSEFTTELYFFVEDMPDYSVFIV
jgi:hypothetical protein